MNLDEMVWGIMEDLRTLNRCVHENHNKSAQKYGLSLDQYHLLLKIKKLNGGEGVELFSPTVGELAKIFKNAQNTMSEKIIRLEKKGVVTRIKDKDDRRVNRITLTSNGKQLLNTIYSKSTEEGLFSSISKMDEDKRKELYIALEELKMDMLKEL